MKIALAQLKPTIGALEENILQHKTMIEQVANHQVDLILFPELSLTGYEPKRAKELATRLDDPIFDAFQELSERFSLTICAGMPLKLNEEIQIGMLIFSPNSPRQSYAKQHLHSDEMSYFSPGRAPVFVRIGGIKIGLAICYESLLHTHSKTVVDAGAQIYLTSVAKSKSGIARAMSHFPEVAQMHRISVLMVNSVGFCDNFESSGSSAVWSRTGNLLGRLSETQEGILIYDNENEHVSTCVR